MAASAHTLRRSALRRPHLRPDDRTRARLIAEAFERLEGRYPQLPKLATQGHVSDSEQRLQTDIKTVELRLQKEIEAVELTLRKEIDQVRADIARSKNDLLKWLEPLMFAQVAPIAALIKLL